MSTAISPPPARTAAPVAGGRHVDPGQVALGDVIRTPAGVVADIRSRETAYSQVILGARDRTGMVEYWAYIAGQTVELLGTPLDGAA